MSVPGESTRGAGRAMRRSDLWGPKPRTHSKALAPVLGPYGPLGAARGLISDCVERERDFWADRYDRRESTAVPVVVHR